MENKSYLIIDWGTSNFRAFLIDENNQCIDKIEKPIGLLSVKNNQFESTLEATLFEWLNDDYKSLSIYMAGMVGSANGWMDCGYITTPVSFDLLTQQKKTIDLSWGQKAYIVPGVSHFSNLTNCHDVMRGEEVQILGLLALIEKQEVIADYGKDYCIILPGTHSKHVTIENHQFTQYASFMTGEFYSLLTKHSILGRDLPKQEACDEAFKDGVLLGAKSISLLHTAFMARTQKLFEQISPDHIEDFLSGIVIGEELSSIISSAYIVGGTTLSNKYQLACQALNISHHIADGDQCFLTGMKKIKEGINEYV